MNETLRLMLGLTLMIFASASPASTCSREVEGNKSCISGETMKCVRVFAPDSGLFIYRWDAVNPYGQVIDVHTMWYKKTPGYTPLPCADSHSAKKLTPGTTRVR